MQIPPEVFGPAGALALAIIVIGGLVKILHLLWKEHLKADQDDRDQRDRAMELLADLTDASKRSAAALEARNRREEASRRRSDP